jgi:hypothetical protein
MIREGLEAVYTRADGTRERVRVDAVDNRPPERRPSSGWITLAGPVVCLWSIDHGHRIGWRPARWLADIPTAAAAAAGTLSVSPGHLPAARR